MGIFDFGDSFKSNPDLEKELVKPKTPTIDDVLDAFRADLKSEAGHQYDDELEYEKQITEEAAFKRFRPDDREWKMIWKAHPELQEEMLKFYDELQNERRSQFMWCKQKECRIPIVVCERIKSLCKGCEVMKDENNMQK